MNAVAFDTLKFVETLEAAGVPRAQAKATAQAVAESIGTADLATKADLALLEQRMMTGFRDIEQKMTIKLGGMMMAIAVLIVAAIKYLPPTH